MKRYAIIGFGMMGKEHLENISLLNDAVVTVVSDIRDIPAEEVSVGTGLVVRSLDAVLNAEDVDALIIVSPNDTHASLLQTIATETDKPVLCEKPACTSYDDVRMLRSLPDDVKSRVWVAMEYRYMPPVSRLIESVHDGVIGRSIMLSIREHRFPFLVKYDNWNRFAARSGGTFVEKCCHFFDLMRLILQDEPVRVYASACQNVNHLDELYDGRRSDILDNGFVTVDFRHGARAMLDLCMFAEGAEQQEELSVTGDLGRVDACVPGGRVTFSPRQPKGPTTEQLSVPDHILAAGDHFGSTYYQHQRFRRFLDHAQEIEVTLEDGLRAVLIGLAAEKSAKERRVIDLDEDLYPIS